jgi:pyridoxine 5-phosphate synthase
VHHRADERHIRRSDVIEISEFLGRWTGPGPSRPEFNIEGDPRPDLLELVLGVRPDQCTLVPVIPGEITSQAGWRADGDATELRDAIARLRGSGIRVSVFIDPTREAVRWARNVGADRVELYTEPFARAFERGEAAAEDSFAVYAEAAALAHEMGLGVNAGHDLDLENLALFRRLPHLDEVSIGHALISHALWVGLDRSVRDYLAALAG